MRIACLVDTTRCIGCRSCQVACKQANRLDADETRFFAAPGGYQNPKRFSPRTYTYVSYHELDGAGSGPRWAFVKRQCLHCTEMYCASVCSPGVYYRTESGAVGCRSNQCIGCAACVDACPFGVPAIDYWNVATPQARKCVFCMNPQEAAAPAERDGRPLSSEALATYRDRLRTPACVKACPTGALRFGQRDALLAEARRRIAADPGRYVDHIYGEKEMGGTGWLYLARVPFEQLGFPVAFPGRDALKGQERLGGGPGGRRPQVSLAGGLSAMVAGLGWFFQRRNDVRRQR